MRILIAGAGIAGLTLAHWLRERGFSPEVWERHDTPGAGGYLIGIHQSGLTVLERMGCSTDCVATASDSACA